MIGAVSVWCAFVGAWLLFTGAVAQAALELRDQPTPEAHDAVTAARTGPLGRPQTRTAIAKTQAWLIVAGGAFLIAIKETGELVEHYHWPEWLFVALVLTVASLATLITLLRVLRASVTRASTTTND